MTQQLGPLPPPSTPWMDQSGKPSFPFRQYFSTLDGLVRALSGIWTPYTPTLSPGAGAFTTASVTGRYIQIGKTVHFAVNISITANGTAAGFINVGTPTTVKTPAVGVGRENSLTGFIVQGLMGAGGNTALLTFGSNNAYPGGSGANIAFSGTYEST
jgi:hypothetical protein